VHAARPAEAFGDPGPPTAKWRKSSGGPHRSITGLNGRSSARHANISAFTEAKIRCSLQMRARLRRAPALPGRVCSLCELVNHPNPWRDRCIMKIWRARTPPVLIPDGQPLVASIVTSLQLVELCAAASRPSQPELDDPAAGDVQGQRHRGERLPAGRLCRPPAGLSWISDVTKLVAVF
jgi:hypothetical protein